MTISQDLVERVRGLTGPDREVDLALWLMFDPEAPAKHEAGKIPLPWLWCVTESVDAALALAERVLPGRWAEILRTVMSAWVLKDGRDYLPIAIVLATLIAIQSSETK